MATHVRLIRSAAVIAKAATRQRGTPVEAKHHALARRILDRQADYLRFATDFRVPLDNNAAEREIRMIKLREKVSGCMRTLAGARDFAAIRSYLAPLTTRKIRTTGVVNSGQLTTIRKPICRRVR
ncbi:IS66 family transposase [Actinokineospora sp. HUAS TT18]|uniref:IS66 family transposase n=1 Tax=Actinokineospora sp. HUAS TT18 TaxID=3447451 RepID=UPI003F527357